MSVIIRGMEMPEHCGYCRFRYDGICHALQKTQYSMEECPLVPVPPHKRLIDAVEFFKDICDSLNEMTAIGIAVDGEWMWGKLNDALENAPTIIPAEEGE